jgi:hypothetical protein
LRWGSSAEIAVGAGAKGNVRGLENTCKSRAERKINLYNLVVPARLEHSFTFPLSVNSVRRRGSSTSSSRLSFQAKEGRNTGNFLVKYQKLRTMTTRAKGPSIHAQISSIHSYFHTNSNTSRNRMHARYAETNHPFHHTSSTPLPPLFDFHPFVNAILQTPNPTSTFPRRQRCHTKH